ncbi:MAG: TM2 domain-containing protein [Lachnospiraceae bacterium]|nr:TM2 domain-containing protein [Lachnospiraceae bacterium]
MSKVDTKKEELFLPQGKSKTTAGLLGIFLGAFGVHNFYLGFKKKAIIQLAVSITGIVISFIAWIIVNILALVVIGFFLIPIAVILSLIPFGIAVWGIVEGIIILMGKVEYDGYGEAIID